MRAVMFPGHNKVKAAIGKHPAMVYENHTDGYLPCPNGTTKNPETRWRCDDKGAPHPRRAPPRPESPPVPDDDDDRAETAGMPPPYVYIHTLLPNARFVPRMACAIKILFQIC
jgi:hypothetical protein